MHWGWQLNDKGMADIKIARNRHRRGRPRIRPDGETRQIICEAARREFATGDYSATSMKSVAHRAEVSTKTLYRLFPNKAALYEAAMSDRLDRLLSKLAHRATDHPDIEEALRTALTTYAALALVEEGVALRRMALQEAGKFGDIAGTFYANAVQRIAVALADWLRLRQTSGLIALDDLEEAASMLLGMVASGPWRAAIFARLPLPSRSQIEARARTCAALFLRGCQVRNIRSR
jgi:AcrR family transcriptional regulator